MDQPPKELLDRKLPARILGHAGLSLLLLWVITSRILPRLQEEQFAGDHTRMRTGSHGPPPAHFG
jgi:hypothetical protein